MLQWSANRFVRWEIFAKYSWISEIFFLSYIILIISFSWLLYIFPLKKLPGKENYREIYAHSLYIFLFKIRYSWILWNIFVNRNIIRKITMLANRNNIYEMKLWRIEMGIYSWHYYQQIDLWRIYLQTIHKLFANQELFAKHCCAGINIDLEEVLKKIFSRPKDVHRSYHLVNPR